MTSRRTPSERLLARLAVMGVPVAPELGVERTHAGYWQRKTGAWVWRHGPVGERGVMVGSVCTVTELARAPRLIASLSRLAPEWAVYPYVEGQRVEPGDLVEAA